MLCYNVNMDFNTKLQQLRTKKGLTQEQLAEKVCVSRVAVSKWEAGRGYPNLDSLKMLAKVFDVSIDSLLSSEELLDIAEVHRKNESNMFRSLLFGIMDFMTLLMFAHTGSTNIKSVIKSIIPNSRLLNILDSFLR